jgi:hypothetical protein
MLRVMLLDSSWLGRGVRLMLPLCPRILGFGKHENLMLSSSNACPKQILLTPARKMLIIKKPFIILYYH